MKSPASLRSDRVATFPGLGGRFHRNTQMPQGGPLSPVLSNVLLDELDKELERREHAFCRYADDCNVYVRSQRAGERWSR